MPRKEEQNQTVTQLSGYQLQATDRQTDRQTNGSVRRKAPKDNNRPVLLRAQGVVSLLHHSKMTSLVRSLSFKISPLVRTDSLVVIILKIKFSLTWPKQLYMAAASMVYLFYALRP